MTFFARCISRESLKGMVRGEGDDDDSGGRSGSTTPNDTAHGGNRFSNYSWKRLSARSRSSLNSPKKQSSPPLSAKSVDGTGRPRPSMEPVMERTPSALTDLEAVKFLIEDWSHKHWRPATPQDQERFDRLEQSDIKPLVALGEGAYGSVNLCRIPAKLPSAGGGGGGCSAAASQSGGRATPPGGAANSAHSLKEAGAAACGGGGAAAAEPAAAAGSSAVGRHRRSRSESLALGPQTSGGSLQNVGSQRGDDGTTGVDGGDDAAAVEEEQLDDDAAAVAAAAEPPPLDDDGGGEAKAKEQEHGQGCSAMQRGSSVNSSINDPQLIVAVKRVPLGWNQERELMQLHRCQRCPFIVRLFGFVDDGSEHCSYVMEWAEGGDLGVMLASLKDRRGSDKQRLLMSEASARYYMGCLLLALEFLHAHGLLHRDIKPSNLLLTSDGTAKLADLGFTVALDANGHTVGCCGTAGYIAPEVYAYGTSKSRMSYGVPADIWSAGATLYQILTGQVVTDTPEDVLKKGWRPPTHPRFSHHLQDLLNRLLAAKPTARPQSALSIMRHPWFAGFDWAALRGGRMKAPYVPSERRRRAPRDSAASTDGSGGGGSAAAAAAKPPPPLAPSAPAAPPAGGAAAAGGSGGLPPLKAFSGGGQRLATVEEGGSTCQQGGAAVGVEGEGKVVQRSALSGVGEGSVKRGREGLLRDGASFETALGTVPTAEARAAADGAAAAKAAAASAAPAPTAPCGRGSDGGGGSGSGSGPQLELESILTTGGHGGHHHVHPHGGHAGVSVRFALGVAECA
ncbi:hypothetical protein PLESTF_000097700 [Pleodorina starrii]|nr:hypothetical protein PLESTM_001263700 [Pleodorina starrii]GLC63911.1 hypothetical protein PLESTF_000097700 [Pleodorina starrii]